MGNALSSLNNSLKRFIANKHGLGEECVYTPKDTGVALDTNLVRQEEDDGYNHREIKSDDICDREIFLINLPYKPNKNDTIQWNSQDYYVDYFEIVGINNFRVYAIADAQTTASPSSTRFTL